MLLFLTKRIGTMLVTAFVLTLIVFTMTNLPAKLETLARTEAGGRLTDAEVLSWIDRNGYGTPMLQRYGEWLGVLPGWVRVAADGEVTGRCVARAGDADAASRPTHTPQPRMKGGKVYMFPDSKTRH